MTDRRKRFAIRSRAYGVRPLAVALLLTSAARCKSTGPNTRPPESVTLRVGVAQVELEPLIQNRTIESLARAQEDGRYEPALAKSWTASKDGLVVNIQIRQGVHFHDGSPLQASTVAAILKTSLPQLMGPAFDDVAAIAATDDTNIQINLKQPSTLLLDAVLETQIGEPGKKDVGTGPFMSVQSSNSTELKANPDYYLGRPNIDRIAFQTYPSVRTAWAEMLRNNVDMVYELGVDALDSLETATAVRLYSFVRRYQYAILFNARSATLQQPLVRQALNAAIDRDALVHDAFSGHALSSSGPVWPKHWASSKEGGITFDGRFASRVFEGLPKSKDPGHHRLTFSCLVAPDEERLALAVKQQLARFDVEMAIEEASLAEINKQASTGNFDAILAPIVSAPTLFRPYLWWHSHGSLNRTHYASAPVDGALDRIRRARTDDEYRDAVDAFQRSVAADPPALFLVWAEGARAVSRRFEIPSDAAGVDILSVLRLWRPVAGATDADKN